MCSKNGLYGFNEIEKKWQQFWQERKTFRAEDCDSSRPKYYVLDMFPYPSGQGLHVGHPEGYTRRRFFKFDPRLAWMQRVKV